VKHLSKRWKRKRNFYSLSSGERKGKSLNRADNLLSAWGCKEISSGAFVIDTNVSEGEHIGKVSLVE
jgi:hypothetical protein